MNIIIYCSIFTTIALAYYGLSKLSLISSVKWIILYCVIGAIVELLSRFLAVNGIPNIFLYYILVWIEIIVLVFYFNSISETIAKIPLVCLFVPICILMFLILLFLDNSKSLSPYSGIFQGLLIFVLGIITFSDELKVPVYSDIMKEPFFWFVASLILYYGCTSIVLIGAKVFSVDKDIFNYIWNYQNILSILKNIMIAIGFRLYKK